MLITRRGALVGAALAVSGCALSPTVRVPDASLAPDPVQEPWAADAERHVAALNATIAAASSSPWRSAALALTDAHLARLGARDPFAEEPEPFFPPAAASPRTGEGAAAAAVEEARAQLTTLVGTAPGQAQRLLLASAACAVASLAVPSLPPVPGGAPRRFAEVTVDDSLPVALSHLWALLHGLELGLGRLPRGHELRGYAHSRLPSAREERNELRDLISGEPPLQPVSLRMPTSMTTLDEIQEGWAVLERGVLDGYGRLTAVDPAWLPRMQAQVPRIQSLGGQLPHWPGWTG